MWTRENKDVEQIQRKEILLFCLCWWPKWRHMMPVDNRAINKARDIEDAIAMVAHIHKAAAAHSWWRMLLLTL